VLFYCPAVRIREEAPNEHAAAADVQREAFGPKAKDAVSYVTDLRESLTSEPGLSVVAIDEDRVVGHALFTRNLLDTPRQLVDIQVLSPIGVLPAYQRQGIGSALVRFGLQELRSVMFPWWSWRVHRITTQDLDSWQGIALACEGHQFGFPRLLSR
jgi:putative acetyltransferase